MKLNHIIAIIGVGALLGLLGSMNPDQVYAPFLMFAGMVVLIAGIVMAASHTEDA